MCCFVGCALTVKSCGGGCCTARGVAMIRAVPKKFSLNVIQLSVFHASSLVIAWWLNSTDSSRWPVETECVCVNECVCVCSLCPYRETRQTHTHTSTVRAGSLFFMFMHQFSTRKGVKCRGGRGWLPWLLILSPSLSLFISVFLSSVLCLSVSQTPCPVSGGLDTGFGLWAESCSLEMSGKWAGRWSRL